MLVSVNYRLNSVLGEGTFRYSLINTMSKMGDKGKYLVFGLKGEVASVWVVLSLPYQWGVTWFDVTWGCRRQALLSFLEILHKNCTFILECAAKHEKRKTKTDHNPNIQSKHYYHFSLYTLLEFYPPSVSLNRNNSYIQ